MKAKEIRGQWAKVDLYNLRETAVYAMFLDLKDQPMLDISLQKLEWAKDDYAEFVKEMQSKRLSDNKATIWINLSKLDAIKPFEIPNAKQRVKSESSTTMKPKSE